MTRAVAGIRQIAVTVSDVAAALAFYRDILGLEFLYAVSDRAPALAAMMPDHELWIGFLRDPDGNLVGLPEEKRP